MAEFRAALMDTGDSGSSADAMSEAVSFACGSSLLKDQPGLVTVSLHQRREFVKLTTGRLGVQASD
jgi:hypothetical protein